jgi:hypothetical protein
MALRGLDEPQVQIDCENVSEGPGDKVQHARALMEAGAFEGNVRAEARLGLAIGPSELAVEAYSSICNARDGLWMMLRFSLWQDRMSDRRLNVQEQLTVNELDEK